MIFPEQIETGPSEPYVLNDLYPGGKYALEIIIDTLASDQSESTMANFTLGTTLIRYHTFCTTTPMRAFTSSSLFYLFYHESIDRVVRLEKSSFFSSRSQHYVLVFALVKCFSHDVESFQKSIFACSFFTTPYFYCSKKGICSVCKV